MFPESPEDGCMQFDDAGDCKKDLERYPTLRVGNVRYLLMKFVRKTV